MENKEWYELQNLANMLRIPIGRIRQAVSFLESAGSIQTRDRPGDKRYKQVHKDSIETLKKSLGL